MISYQLPELRGLGRRRPLPDAPPAGDGPDEVRVRRLDRVIRVIDGADVPRAAAGALSAGGRGRAAARPDLLREVGQGRLGRDRGAHARLPEVKKKERVRTSDFKSLIQFQLISRTGFSSDPDDEGGESLPP